jgi:predicted dehydrogenase
MAHCDAGEQQPSTPPRVADLGSSRSPILADNDQKFTVAGVFDVSQRAMRHVCRRYPTAQAYEIAKALVQSTEIDAVFILTPDNTHSRFLEMAIKIFGLGTVMI